LLARPPGTSPRGILQEKPDIEVVGEADDGAQAVELTAQLRPDVVIMDMSMPVMSGVEATRRIKEADPLTSVFGPEVVRTIRALLTGTWCSLPTFPRSF
jgi:DNA-binding NarL/FixJ family response regulator